MPEPSLDEVATLWRSVNRLMHDRFRQAFQGCELHPGAMFLLQNISQHPGLTIAELTRRTMTVKSHVSKMADQLVSQGYAEKRADPTDQRLTRIYATRAATGILASMEERAGEAWAGVTREIPADQREHVVRGLRVLLAALEKANEPEPIKQ